MTRRVLLIGALALVILAGCRNGKGDVSDTAGDELRPRVAEIRDLATARQADQANRKLVDLRALVEDLQGRGELSEKAAGEVLAAADAVSTQLGLITTTTTTEQPRHRDADEHEDGDDEKEDTKRRDRRDPCLGAARSPTFVFLR